MSYGQELCKEYLNRLIKSRHHENYRPDWLFGMELDFYFPEINLAIEFNGDQHYYATALCADPTAQKKRDLRKKYICKDRGITLITLKAIDLICHVMRRKLKRVCKLDNQVFLGDINYKATKYRKHLIEKYHSPTCHKNKGMARKKTLAKLAEKHPPIYKQIKQP